MTTHLSVFRTMLAKDNWVILDTETTGLHDGEIVQIAIIDQHGQPLINTYVKPHDGIPADATRIHGITEEMVADEPTWAEISPRVEGILGGRDVIVYNAAYDRKIMHLSAERAGLPHVDWKGLAAWHCAMEAYAEFHGEWNSYHGSFRWQSLTNACRQCGIEVADAHSALGDCLMTLQVIRYLSTQNGGV